MSKTSQKFWREQFEKNYSEEYKNELIIYNQNYVSYLEKTLCNLYDEQEKLSKENNIEEKTVNVHTLEDELIPYKLKQDFINEMLRNIENLIDSSPEDWTNHNRFRVKSSLNEQLDEFEKAIKESILKNNHHNTHH